ncbi:hypothetical protein [Desulforamulus putei]|uniref:Uncharacterized protein n=1 Tax=Desulforamulus putei DSM 12395 TaxID=1121429 RepID=A0A1M4U4L1_9FIRM|nr:hypothetical protein [Desulforamulus putei]SHE51574.1 hypothetical protein SAMN02745133_00577 [Desulforamulus putei DSM 12395]
MELEMNVNKQCDLFADLVSKVCNENRSGTVDLPSSQLTDEIWEEIVKYNLNPENPCLVYLLDSPTDNQVKVKVVCKTA